MSSNSHQQLMNSFSQALGDAPKDNAAKSSLAGNILLLTANTAFTEAAEKTFPPSMVERFGKFVQFAPLGDELLQKVAEAATRKLLDSKNLTTRQRNVAEKFIAEQTAGAYDPEQGGRSVTKKIRSVVTGGAFATLMEEHSPNGTKRGFEKAIKGGAKKAGAAPATARFTRRRAP